MTYSEKLRSPRWQKRRLEILNRDGFRCRICGDGDHNLQVHHLVYGKKDPWDYPAYCLITLCESCHQERTEILDRLVNAIRLQHAFTPTSVLDEVAQKEIERAMDAIPEEAVKRHEEELEGGNGR